MSVPSFMIWKKIAACAAIFFAYSRTKLRNTIKVGTENPSGNGGRIDAVVKMKEDAF